MTFLPFLRLLTRRGFMTTVMLMLAAAPALAQSPVKQVDIALVDGRASGAGLTVPARGAPVLRLTQGESVELRFASDRPMDLHLHGYRIETRAAPGAPAVMTFVARAAGRFAVETHAANGRHVALLYLEVHPR
jgi:FtsP/CotA-like multicopper oxidase with cupredoxin domain